MDRQKLRKKREGKIHRKATIMIERQNLSGAMEQMHEVVMMQALEARGN